jgi:alpha-N-acetylglucosamine transferase
MIQFTNLVFKMIFTAFIVIIYFSLTSDIHIFYKFSHKNFQKVSEKINKKILTSCLNQVEYEHEISVWTFLTDDSNYALSAIKLLKSIELNSKSTMFDKLILELREKRLNTEIKSLISKNPSWKICQVDRIPPRDEKNTFPRFRDQFTKLILWNMTEYKAVVYFDSDTFVIGNINKLLNIYKTLENTEYKIAVTQDIRAGEWMKAFNMGIFSIKPNKTEFNRLIRLKNDYNFTFEVEMSEQGFLNEAYRNQWFDFGFENNANLAVYSQKRQFWNEHEPNINVIHYTMNKPWDCSSEYMKICDKWKNFNS